MVGHAPEPTKFRSAAKRVASKLTTSGTCVRIDLDQDAPNSDIHASESSTFTQSGGVEHVPPYSHSN